MRHFDNTFQGNFSFLSNFLSDQPSEPSLLDRMSPSQLLTNNQPAVFDGDQSFANENLPKFPFAGTGIPVNGTFGFGFGFGFGLPEVSKGMNGISYGLNAFDDYNHLNHQMCIVDGSKTSKDNVVDPASLDLDEQAKIALGRKKIQRTRKIRKTLKGQNVIKGQWTPEEDRMLIRLVKQHGTKEWSEIAKLFNRRIGKQCRERWHNHLKPNIKKDSWSEIEDEVLIQAHQKFGNRWSKIAGWLPGRTENAIKNHWNATKRRKYPLTLIEKDQNILGDEGNGSTHLYNYIKSLALDGEKNSGCSEKPVLATVSKTPISVTDNVNDLQALITNTGPQTKSVSDSTFATRPEDRNGVEFIDKTTSMDLASWPESW